jgi:Leucine-rich repeat (LRR) protein
LIPTDTSFDFGLSNDPFNQHRDDGSTKKILQSRIETARISGRLNIAAMGLREIPAEVMNMYNLESIGGNGGSWAESVDLTRFVAADNELEMINDSIFPDCDPQDMADSEDGQGNIFGGLETLDLHGNMLIALPMGLRRLPQLTSLNLVRILARLLETLANRRQSQNRLSNNCLEVLSQITTLKDLKLGGNLLYGPLDPCFSRLENLEIVDLHGNNISSLPSNLGNVSHLRVLNISENAFEKLPFEILVTLPLTELVARKNQLSGTLIEDTVDSFPTLQTLDVSANQLTQLTSSGNTVDFPSLHQLCVSINRLQALPDISSWKSLITLSANENSINAIPEGFAQLKNLRSVDFSSNDIRVIPPEVGRMANLAMLQLSANPLRDKKFSSISTDDMKNILVARLEPEATEHVRGESSSTGTDETAVPHSQGRRGDTRNAEQGDDHDDSRSDFDDFATPPTSAPHSPARSRSHTVSSQTWPVRGAGVLDRSNTQISALHPVICSKVAASTTVREVQLHHNLFTSLPDSLSFFATTLTCLSLSHNQLTGEAYLGGSSGDDNLELPALKELNLASNHITGLMPLVRHLQAPKMEKLDVSLNRISALPQGTQLRDAFPNLAVLLIPNNHLIDIEPASIKGMRIVDASNNDIAHLNPRIGLLGGGSSGGLERFDVSGNRFRVPRWNILERGTEATLRFLRSRVPAAEIGAWKEANGQGDDGDGEADVD